MLTPADDYPLHQTAEPIAFSGTDRNFYDRYFFNAQSGDGTIFVAVALGVYPQLDVMDASVSVLHRDRQYNLHASKHMAGDRLDLKVGPIVLTIDRPLEQATITIDDHDGPLAGQLTFTSRHFPIEEPRFTRRVGTRAFMDYTRLTGNGTWSGTLTVDGDPITLDPAEVRGTRDRSWGVRPVGASDPQPPAGAGPRQFHWLWTPVNFDEHVAFFHTNDDEHGRPWNRRAVVQPLGGEPVEFEQVDISPVYRTGTRRIEQLTVTMTDGDRRAVLSFETGRPFYMSGLGYTDPRWGHGRDHGPLEVETEVIDLTTIDDNDPRHLHIQALSSATLKWDGATHHGRGVVEQMFIGPHAPSGMTDRFGPADPPGPGDRG